MKPWGWVGLIPLLLIASLQLSGCNGDSEAKDSEKEEKNLVIPVEIGKVFSGDIDANYEGSATLEAVEEAAVVAEVTGVVEAIMVEEGDRVKAGQALAKLDSERLQLEVTRAKADLEKLTNDFNRAKAMYRKKLASVENYQRLEYELASQKAAYDLAVLKLKDSTIRAPIAGVVARRMIKIGNMITTNTAAFHISQFDRLHALVHVPEREISKLKVGQPAQAVVEVWRDEVFSGHIERINPVVDADSGTVKVTVELSDDSSRLRPGMFGRIRIRYDRHLATMLAPRDAVLTEDAQNTVFVVADGKAIRTPVEVGYVDGDFVEIVDGVKLDDQLVTSGHTTLKDGAQVEVVKPAAETNAG